MSKGEPDLLQLYLLLFLAGVFMVLGAIAAIARRRVFEFWLELVGIIAYGLMLASATVAWTVKTWIGR